MWNPLEVNKTYYIKGLYNHYPIKTSHSPPAAGKAVNVFQMGKLRLIGLPQAVEEIGSMVLERWWFVWITGVGVGVGLLLPKSVFQSTLILKDFFSFMKLIPHWLHR